MFSGKRMIKSIMALKKIKSGFIADSLEMDRQAFYNWLNRDNPMMLDKLIEVADVLGCDVALIDRETGEVYK